MMPQRRKVWTVLMAFMGLGVLFGFAPSAHANSTNIEPYAYYQIDGGEPQYLQLTRLDKEGSYEFGLVNGGLPNGTLALLDGNGDGGVVTSLQGTLNGDPSIAYGVAVIDFGAPSVFGFVFGTPIVPIGTPNAVTASLSYSLTDNTDNGISLAPIAPFVQTSDVGFPVTNMGVDADAVGFSALGGGTGGPISYVGPVFNLGPQPGPGPGPWTWLQVSTSFSLSGGGDIATLNGGASINSVPIPEPATMLLLGAGLVGLVGLKRKIR